MFDFKGQGALEYLLLIGGAVLVAVIVVSLLLGSVGTTKESQETQFALQRLRLECDANVILHNIKSTDIVAIRAKCSNSCDQFPVKDSTKATIDCTGP